LYEYGLIVHAIAARSETMVLPVGPVQSLVDALHHEVAVERLPQVCDGTRRIDLTMNPFIGKSGHENDRNFTSQFQEPRLQFGTCHPGHLDVGDQARCVVQMGRPQELFSRAKRARDETAGSEKAGGRTTNGLVVIDNANSQILRHGRPFQKQARTNRATSGR